MTVFGLVCWLVDNSTIENGGVAGFTEVLVVSMSRCVCADRVLRRHGAMLWVTLISYQRRCTGREGDVSLRAWRRLYDSNVLTYSRDADVQEAPRSNYFPSELRFSLPTLDVIDYWIGRVYNPVVHNSEKVECWKLYGKGINRRDRQEIGR